MSRIEDGADAFSVKIDPERMHDAEYDARIAAKIHLALKGQGVADHGGFWR
jgi:DNA polymerase III epsilon subunit-like protein